MVAYAPVDANGLPNDTQAQWARDTAAALTQMAATQGAQVVSKTVTYAGGTTNAPGNVAGTGNPNHDFTVTGQCLVAIIGVVSTTFVGTSATLKVGNATTTTRYMPSLTATTLVAGSTWDSTGLVTAGTAPKITPAQVAFNGEIIEDLTATANITAGVITYYCFYLPLSAGAKVVAD